ncbi:MAG: sulfite exporter TauE/SafE family protein [Anaerolineae bacterium]|nr:sulfite exporter TauE/SafE family protein [Anaerolineae bacterium]
MPLEPFEYLLIALAAVAAGAVNALAGGGTLITFPVLTAVGIPAVAANVTNTVALSPGYLGATLAQKAEILDQRRRLRFLVPAAALGGLTGGLLLLNTSEKLFRELVPYLILLASLLLAVQEPLRRRLVARSTTSPGHVQDERWTAVPVFFAAIYGGYFGAGLSVIVLAVLGLVLDDSLTRLNALKQVVSFVTNSTAALLFLFSGQVVWSAAVVMAVGAMAGGALGGRLAGRIQPSTLRRLVVTIGVIVSIIYFVRG